MLARLVVLGLLLTGLAGCNGDGDGTTTQRSTSCPSWMAGRGDKLVVSLPFEEDAAPQEPDVFPAAESVLSDEGRLLDRYDLDFGAFEQGTSKLGVVVQDARLEIRFFRNDTHEALPAYNLSKGPPGAANPPQYGWVFGPGTHKGFILQIPMSQPPTLPDPAPLRIEYTFTPNLDGQPGTPSRATVDFVGTVEYRIC